jgi:hypothetical protein
MTPEKQYELTGQPVKLAGRRLSNTDSADFLREFERSGLTGFIHIEWSVERDNAANIPHYGNGYLMMKDGKFINAYAAEGDYAKNEDSFNPFDLYEEIEKLNAAETGGHFLLLANIFFVKRTNEIGGYAEAFHDPRAARLKGEPWEMEKFVII